jgi:hypothetical protein
MLNLWTIPIHKLIHIPTEKYQRVLFALISMIGAHYKLLKYKFIDASSQSLKSLDHWIEDLKLIWFMWSPLLQ